MRLQIAIVTLLGGLLMYGTSFAQPKKSASTPAFRWDKKQVKHYPKVPLQVAMTRHARFVLREVVSPDKNNTYAELRMELHKAGVSSVSWRYTIKHSRSRGRVGATLMHSEGRIYVARFNQIATGCSLHAFDSDGKRLWSVALQGVGSIGHSKWSNRVQLAMHEGAPVVFGVEGGNLGYTEVRDPDTGALISNSRHTVK